MADLGTVKRLKELAYRQRVSLIELCGAYDGTVHIGGDLSMTDLLVALYHYGMNVDPCNIAMPERDRFILSKGHAAVCMYIAMAMRGFFDLTDITSTYGQLDSAYGMHPCKVQLPGVETSSGSLGHGLSLACGMALMARQRKEKYRIYCMMGDGETCEGSVWEAAMLAGSYKLGNIVGVVDRNHQFMTQFSETGRMNLEPYAEKWRAFGWHAIEIDGHDMGQIVDAIDALPAPDSERPTVIIAETIKGKGISYMERDLGWHAGKLSEENMREALTEMAARHERGDI
jgi:transketolase